ncbi:ankyrin repeat protein, putative [Trichomonas vaginalis G3]|uniref:Ankyrin repeat protein, putative n=1 Tax=Trichomonas vaginalis (strain ATCC PRA-98 / G3) TaxID=412133 RepID=A2EW89_TRIV3|nr:Ankyrin repeat family [Trichomonas vaginalis G3]EAY03066.1 ankyrin repeat protein, putative [Trichomonas vaginalis G3]KAI5484830.1 Ankyrin repeat family [Trichomonas vaginalis G3]|eukprot:XP_001315289.1 ankyrin repeat protein [Trichomonas vaginalis G3]
MDINEKDGNEETALYIAVSNNSKETVDILLSHGANVNEKIKYGNTALHIATHFNYKEMTELLLSHGAKY